MANFTTHLNVSAFVSASVAVGISSLYSPKDALIYFLAGMIGGVLPDIDHDNSIPIKVLHFLLANIISFIVIYKFIGKIPIFNLLGLWIGVYLVVSFIFYIFKKMTTHRGIFHSIPMAFIFWFVTTIFAYRYFGLAIYKSYLIGFFVFLGYITHLILDEIYSVDITGKKLKKSFGTAFKLYSHNKISNLIVYGLLIMLVIALPHKELFINFTKRLINV